MQSTQDVALLHLHEILRTLYVCTAASALSSMVHAHALCSCSISSDCADQAALVEAFFKHGVNRLFQCSVILVPLFAYQGLCRAAAVLTLCSAP